MNTRIKVGNVGQRVALAIAGTMLLAVSQAQQSNGAPVPRQGTPGYVQQPNRQYAPQAARNPQSYGMPQGRYPGYGQPQTRGYSQSSPPQRMAQAPTGYSQQGGYPQGHGAYPGGAYPPQNRYPPQNAYPRQDGYAPSSPYPRPNGYPQPSGYPAQNGYAQPGYGQQGSGGSPAVPNRPANYNAAQQRQSEAARFWQQQGSNNGSPAHGEHLQQWMQHHNQLNPQDQQRALTHEPGFNQLPQQTQQRMLDRLQRLNNMPPNQRERVIQRSEQMERLSPDQRRDVRNAMGQLGALPTDRRRAVARSFRELRPLSPAQRDQLMNSPEYRQQFTNEERGTLGNLLQVSPMLPQQ